jgi:hypothetical protein
VWAVTSSDTNNLHEDGNALGLSLLVAKNYLLVSRHLSSTCHPLVIHVASTSHPLVIHLSSTWRPLGVHLASTCPQPPRCQKLLASQLAHRILPVIHLSSQKLLAGQSLFVIHLLSTCHLSVLSLLVAKNYLLVSRHLSSICHPLVIHLSSTCHPLGIHLSSTWHPLVLSLLVVKNYLLVSRHIDYSSSPKTTCWSVATCHPLGIHLASTWHPLGIHLSSASSWSKTTC